MSNPISVKWLNLMLRTVRDVGLGPTLTTRLLYLGSTILCYVVRLPTNSIKVEEPELKRLESGVLSQSQVDTVIHYGFKYLYGKLGYPFSLPDPELRSHRSREAVDNIKAFVDRRDNDGWRLAYVDANESQYYLNGSRSTNHIDVDTDPNAPQDLSFITNPDKWTPLKHGDKIQKYLTPEWCKVLPLVDIQKFIDIYNTNFNPNRDQDIKEILDVYENMTDYHRVVAEYFQGGKVTPPGIWNVWGIYAGESLRFSERRFADFLYALNRSLFTASIVAWHAKLAKTQARPIQLIRLLTPERQVTTWDGTRVSNKVWRPFQQSNFRTPPFPDFVSGHSTFSGAAASVFNHYFGNDLSTIEFKPMSAEHSDMISPLLKNSHGSTVKSIACDFGSSEVAQGGGSAKFPTCATVLNFTSWDQLAELSGISRIYGGIHGMSANGIGLLLGRTIAKEFIA